ncbi:MAG: electron transport protein [Bacteroidetes bacterium]|nr:MAG: electron transport protein [Bacteroidota bacterium]
MSTRIQNILIAVAAAALAFTGWYMWREDKPMKKLPYINAVAEARNKQVDTAGKHIVSDFSLLNQSGKTVTRADFKNSIFVADFFFTNCKSICPVMTSQMQRVYEKFKGDPEVKFISHTVDPARDTVESLAAYAAQHHADASQWHFVTGDKPQLYELARKSYFVSTTEGNGGADDFVHSQLFSLVDKEGYVRGIYDGTDSSEVDRLMIDMETLLKGYRLDK